MNGDLKGDVVLPVERTVEQIAREAVEIGFRRAGFRVHSPTDRESTEATPIEIDVRQFWAWPTLNEDFDLMFEVRLFIRGDIPPFEQGREVRGRSSKSQKWGSEEEFLTPANDALNQIVVSVQKAVGQAN